jgi:hypothetical protein
MGYSQWARITIKNFTRKKTLEIRSFNRHWGKLHATGDQSGSEIQPNEFNNKKIEYNSKLVISASGRSVGVGCAGDFEIHVLKPTTTDANASEKVCKVVYDCPWWWWSDNKFEVKDQHEKFTFGDLTFTKNGALGDKTIEIKEY